MFSQRAIKIATEENAKRRIVITLKFFHPTSSVNFLKAAHEPSKSNGRSSVFPNIFGKNLLKMK